MLTELHVKEIEGMWFGAAYEGEEVVATSFASDEKRVSKDLRNSLPRNVVLESSDRTSRFAERVLNVLRLVYDGKDADVSSVQLNMDRLPDYTKRVIGAVCMIPAGYVTSYGLVAKAVGGGARAVGNVMARNPFAPLCPCHRVVAADFGLGGYGGGLSLKIAFLKRERRGFGSERDITVGNGKLHVFPVERVFEKATNG